MVVSNEPGYYKGGHGGFGVRIESLFEVLETDITNEGLGKRYRELAIGTELCTSEVWNFTLV